VRVKSLQVDYSDGTRQVVQLQDVQGLQVIEPAKTLKAQWIKLTILSLYPSYKWPQAAMSETRVYEVIH
jgi:hypothetical protein